MFFSRSAGVKFTDRGNVASADFIKTDLTTDASWRILDLSAIIPVGTKLVKLRVAMIPLATTGVLKFKTNGNADDVNKDENVVSVDGAYGAKTIEVAPDADGKIQYWGTSISWVTIVVTVCSWLK